jgi:hypothetical protein
VETGLATPEAALYILECKHTDFTSHFKRIQIYSNRSADQKENRIEGSLPGPTIVMPKQGACVREGALYSMKKCIRFEAN